MTFTDILILIAIFLLAIVLKEKFEVKNEQPKVNTSSQIYPYRKKMLLTKAEYAFYQTLKAICDKENLIICPKVRMEDFLEVTDKKNLQKYRGYIRSRHIDFILCDNKLHMLAGIESDDNSHKQEKVKQVDNFKDAVFNAISVPLFRVKMSDGLYKEQITTIISNLIINKDSKTMDTQVKQTEI